MQHCNVYELSLITYPLVPGSLSSKQPNNVINQEKCNRVGFNEINKSKQEQLTSKIHVIDIGEYDEMLLILDDLNEHSSFCYGRNMWSGNFKADEMLRAFKSFEKLLVKLKIEEIVAFSVSCGYKREYEANHQKYELELLHHVKQTDEEGIQHMITTMLETDKEFLEAQDDYFKDAYENEVNCLFTLQEQDLNVHHVKDTDEEGIELMETTMLEMDKDLLEAQDDYFREAYEKEINCLIAQQEQDLNSNL